MGKTIELRSAKGVRNDIALERFSPNDLAEAVNVDLDETGEISRRLGTSLIHAGVAHSLFGSNSGTYVVFNDWLSLVSPTLTLTPITRVTGRVAYAEITGATYWSDGVLSGVLNGATNIPWGITPPTPPTIVAVFGNMLPGRYLATLTYIRSTGEESGASPYSEITLASSGGISFRQLAVSTDPEVTHKHIYLTPRGGETAYVAMTIPNNNVSATVGDSPPQGAPLTRAGLSPPPKGQVVAYFKGRALVGSGTYLWISRPYSYGAFDLSDGFVGFDSEIRTVAVVDDGVYVGTACANYWLAGSDPDEWRAQQVAPYGAVLGTEAVLRADLVGPDGVPGNCVAWMSHRGLLIGLDGGKLFAATGARYIPPIAREGASLLKLRGGSPHLITTLYN